MIPVRLEVQNFLSYGTDAPPLEFDDFTVACLSGRNGQGKSALLDAITWSIWGEARKSSGRRKPDEELIRIGTRHMEVTFTFDLEATRYRVTRTFSRSATGKTTSSDLEFQVFDPESDAYRPLTGPSQRDTQAVIDDTVGLDYDTFINSAFLLQGRSDEFTKKSPSQRKEILVRILNLRRYDKLAGKARDRWRTAKSDQQRAEREVERLQEALADVPEWKAERTTVRKQVAAQRQTLAELRGKERRLTEKRADLESKAREAESVREAIGTVDGRIAQHREDAAETKAKIEAAKDLMARSDAIRADYETYEALQKERNRLDEKRDLHRGVEKQIEQKRSALQNRKNELEKKLDRLTVEVKNFRQNRNDCTAKLSQRTQVRAALKSAQAARQRVEEMATVRDRREQIKERITQIEQHLVGARQQIQGEREALREQIRRHETVLAESGDLDETLTTLRSRQERRTALQKKLETTKSRGTAIAERIRETQGEVKQQTQRLKDQKDELDRLRRADAGACPTCGTELTPSHRREVEQDLQGSIDRLASALDTQKATIAELQEKRKRLLTTYQETQSALQELEGVPEQIATVREQKRALDDRRKALQAKKQQAAELERKIQEKDYGAEARAKRTDLQEALRNLSFQPKRFDALQNEAAQVERYTERLREMEELAGRKDELERKISQHESAIQEIREALSDGSAFGPLPGQIEKLEQKLEQIGFDPERFRQVRKKLDDLSGAAERMKDLVDAQSNRDDYAAQYERTQERIASEQEEKAKLKERLADLTEALETKDAVAEAQEAMAESVREAESALTDLQKTLGMLEERLENAESDRAALKDAREAKSDAAHRRTLYKHLRTAFGKHGIPSLIIEETLPEIEERANVLLDRLTDGRMRVRLETLKEKKTGGTKETLEIIITDEQGVSRPYETFSGGESFRVNFALRIALAQLLAERSGVRVRTLVIDEGFGTQDEQGIERLVESIQAIREDFSKILVITHLERLKQAFPVRIEVEKDPVTGSTFDVNGIG